MWGEVPKANVVLKSLNKMLIIKDTLALYKDFYQYINEKDMFVLPQKKTLEWEDVFPFIYLMAAFEGVEENKFVKHLVIDEMQDYTPIQFSVLNMMYPCQKAILGDFGQVLNPCHLHSLDESRSIYKDARFVAIQKMSVDRFVIIYIQKIRQYRRCITGDTACSTITFVRLLNHLLQYRLRRKRCRWHDRHSAQGR